MMESMLLDSNIRFVINDPVSSSLIKYVLRIHCTHNPEKEIDAIHESEVLILACWQKIVVKF